MPNPPAAQPVSSDDDNGDRIIDGLRYPRTERQIDQLGFETTKHSLRFRGRDWDLVLTQRREELTKNFIAGAAAGTGEPEENVGDLRFVVNETYLSVKFSIRHRAAIPQSEIQEKLATYPWKEVKQLYKPRQQTSRQDRMREKQETENTLGATRRQVTGVAPQNLSFFGRANVGPDGPQFTDERDRDEEPVAYEEQIAAKRKNSRLLATVGIV